MAATQATLGQNAVFYTGVAGSPITYTAITEVKEIKPPDESLGDVDVTHLASPNFGMEFIPGLYNAGQIEINGNYLGDTAQELLEGLITARTVFPFKITAPVQTTKTCTVTGTCFVTKYARGPIGTGKATEFSATFKVTGIPTTGIA